MDSFLTSTVAVALAEIGDKTQLLTLFLVLRYHRPGLIVAGILLATLLNHGLSAWLGSSLTDLVPTDWLRYILAASFICLGLWILIPDSDESTESGVLKFNPFIATTILFFVAEIGDKTQVATVLLAAKYHSLMWVTLGTTLGMMLANVPVAYAGKWLMEKMNLSWLPYVTSAIFILTGITTLFYSG